LFSILDRSEDARKEREAFAAQEVRSETGFGASGASGH
jgi:cation/acetate symporter